MKTGELEQVIYCATLAPSGHNAQPWKFRIEGEDNITILPDYHRVLPVADPDNHELFISLGCALENLVVAAEHFGYRPEVKIYSGQQVSIKVKLNSCKEEGGNLLFGQVKRRQSTRNKYDGKPIPKEHLLALKASALGKDVDCKILADKTAMAPVTALVKEACLLQYSDEVFINELVKWIRFSKMIATKKADGLSGAVSGNPSVPEWFGKFLLGATVSAEKEAAKCEEMINSSSALAIFTTTQNDEAGWINLGRSFERFALTASSLGIKLAHENMACEVPAVRQKLASLLALNANEQPLLVVRLGYSEAMPYSYRRPMHKVILPPVEEVLG